MSAMFTWVGCMSLAVAISGVLAHFGVHESIVHVGLGMAGGSFGLIPIMRSAK